VTITVQKRITGGGAQFITLKQVTITVTP